VGIVLFLLSGYGLIMFRNSLVPFHPAARRLITVAIIAAGIVAVVARLPADPTSPHSALQTFALAALLAVWAFCILEPITRFVMSARGRPAVESARLRAMSLGYAALLAVVLIGTIGGSLTPAASLLIDVIALAVVPILYVAFFPPAWLRRIWRQPEEEQLRHALHDLLLYSPDRATLARRALGWAERLVGGTLAERPQRHRAARFARWPWRDGHHLRPPHASFRRRGAVAPPAVRHQHQRRSRPRRDE
jgi:hypothetical protein